MGLLEKKAFQSIFRDNYCIATKIYMHTYDEKALWYTWKCKFWGS